jgi:hypothetical protein
MLQSLYEKLRNIPLHLTFLTQRTRNGAPRAPVSPSKASGRACGERACASRPASFSYIRAHAFTPPRWQLVTPARRNSGRQLVLRNIVPYH